MQCECVLHGRAGLDMHGVGMHKKQRFFSGKKKYILCPFKN
jgi:hypothetical protein